MKTQLLSACFWSRLEISKIKKLSKMPRTSTMKVKKIRTNFHLAKVSNLTMIRDYQAIHARLMLNLNALRPISPQLRISLRNLLLASTKIRSPKTSRLIRILFKMNVYLSIKISQRRILWVGQRVARRVEQVQGFQSKLSRLKML